MDSAALPCPVCGRRKTLSIRALGGHQVESCASCGGLWLSRRLLDQLVERAGREPGPTAAKARPSLVTQCGPLYRSCPRCATVMNRMNFGASSGVVVDRCGEHGLWLDAGELEAILAWARSGGAGRTLPPASKGRGAVGAGAAAGGFDVGDALSPIAEGVFDVLTSLWWW